MNQQGDIKILNLRHRAAPAMNGCRWCGFLKIDHANRWVPGKKWHSFVDPTDAQRKARRMAGAKDTIPARLHTTTIITNMSSTANYGRTRVD